MTTLRRIFLFTLLALSTHFGSLSAQPLKETELKTTIGEVTVFLQGAQITRTGKVDIANGKSALVLKGLSPHIDEKSIQVKGVSEGAAGEFTILSVNHRYNYLGEQTKNAKIDSLNQVLDALNRQIANSQARLEVLSEKQSLLNANKKLGGEATGTNLTQLKLAIEFYDRELTAIKAEWLTTQAALEKMDADKLKLQKQLGEVLGKDMLPTGEIEVRVEAPAKTRGEFVVTYLVANAGWYPKYDIRVESVDQPLSLKYKADVYQNTGVDWKDVKLKFSNGNPNQSGVAPELQTWYLNYARNTSYNRQTYGVASGSIRSVSGVVTDQEVGDGLPGVNVQVQGTTIGTITDVDGRYSLTLPNNATVLEFSFVGMVTQQVAIGSSSINVSMQADVSQLNEVVVTGYGIERSLAGRVAGVATSAVTRGPSKAKSISTTTVENQTTVEFAVEKPYSIPSNGEKLTVDLSQYDIETIYEYHAVPKLDKDAFLIARIINWDQYNLLEGEANLYFEDGFVGRSILDARALTDTLDISLGRDKNIVIGRTKVDTFSKRRFAGTNTIETRQFEILVRNKKSQAIKLTLFDQVPVSAIGEITVTPTELSGGKHNEQTGEVKWELNLAGQQQQKLTLGYEVKYPRREKVVLE
jgi:prefoldin subunit 5